MRVRLFEILLCEVVLYHVRSQRHLKREAGSSRDGDGTYIIDEVKDSLFVAFGQLITHSFLSLFGLFKFGDLIGLVVLVQLLLLVPVNVVHF